MKKLSDLKAQDRLYLIDQITRKLARHQGWIIDKSANVLESKNPRLKEFASLAETALEAVESFIESTQ